MLSQILGIIMLQLYIKLALYEIHLIIKLNNESLWKMLKDQFIFNWISQHGRIIVTRQWRKIHILNTSKFYIFTITLWEKTLKKKFLIF